MIPERVIWTYVVQISSAIKQVHEARLAVRTIDATKILVTGQNRFVGIFRPLRGSFEKKNLTLAFASGRVV